MPWIDGYKPLANDQQFLFETVQAHLDAKGFSVLTKSFELDGKPRLIEVKATRFGALTPFFVPKNEVAASEMLHTHYRLCRVFDVRREPRFFALPGSLQQSCLLEPEQSLTPVG